MAIPLNETQVAKIKADWPNLNINQIASKHGVGWITVKKIVAPESQAAHAKPARRAKTNGKGKHSDAQLLTSTWWEKLPLDERVKIMLERL